MKKHLFLFVAISICLFGVSANAADTLQGVAVYVTGDFTDPGWSPGEAIAPDGTVEGLRLYDDGATNGDAVADDGLWTCIVPGYSPGQELEWKVANLGWDPVNVPSSNLTTWVPSDGVMEFFLDTNFKGDGFLPDVEGNTEDGIPYTPSLLEVIRNADSVSLTGAFQGQLSGQDNDWSPEDPAGQILMKDDGAAPDETANDGIYTGTVTGLSPGTYGFKGVLDFESWDTAKFGSLGYVRNGGDNIEFIIGASTDVVTIFIDGNTARTGAFNADYNPIPGPPWFAHSELWGEVFTDAEMLGAEADGTFRKIFTVSTAGDHELRIRDQAGAQFPGSGGYPFTTTSDGQDVLVIFDPTTHNDPYYPQSNFVLAVDASTKAPLNEWDYVQPVGNWMVDFGGSDWSPDDSNFAAFDEGDPVDGDVVAGDAVYAARLEALVAADDRELKAVGLRTGAGDENWFIQFGGASDGLTVDGNNSTSRFGYTPVFHTFQIDTLTGRVGVGDAVPERPSLQDPVPVGDWQLY